MTFGQTYCPESDCHGNKVHGETTYRILNSLGFELFYYRQAEKTNRLGQRQTAHFFGVRKIDTTLPKFDLIHWGDFVNQHSMPQGLAK